MDNIMALIGPYYGLDWLTLLFGTAASIRFSNHRMKSGFVLAIIASLCGITISYLAHQTGFIVYNALLIAINARGFINGDRRKERSIVLPASEGAEAMQPSTVPVRAPAR